MLVAKKEFVQDVKSIVSKLAAGKRTERVDHRKVYRAMGMV